MESFVLNIDQRKLIRKKLHEVRNHFVVALLHEAAQTHKINFNILKTQLKIDFETYIYFLPILLRIIYKKYFV